MIPVFMPACVDCENRKDREKGAYCPAFPEGIPRDIWEERIVMGLTGQKYDPMDILNQITTALNNIYSQKEFGNRVCNVDFKGKPFRAFLFREEDLGYGIEYADNEEAADKGLFEDGDLFYFEDYRSMDSMIAAMRQEIDAT